jgi:peptidoglycan-associated lipoprotein
MIKPNGRSLQWMIIVGLIGVLALGGCSRKNVLATSTGAESEDASAKRKAAGGQRSGGPEMMDKGPGMGEGLLGEGSGGTKGAAGLRPDGSGESGLSGRSTESLGPIGSGPLQGFNKGSREERLGDTPPMMIAKAEPQDLESRKTRDENRRELTDIYFAFDKWVLSDEGKKNLLESAGFLKQNPGAKIVIEGYCDERGSREYNLVLGEKRAKETRRYLADLGIQNPVSVTSFGKERQVCTDRNESCYWKNRRAHLTVDAGK